MFISKEGLRDLKGENVPMSTEGMTSPAARHVVKLMNVFNALPETTAMGFKVKHPDGATEALFDFEIVCTKEGFGYLMQLRDELINLVDFPDRLIIYVQQILLEKKETDRPIPPKQVIDAVNIRYYPDATGETFLRVLCGYSKHIQQTIELLKQRDESFPEVADLINKFR